LRADCRAPGEDDGMKRDDGRGYSRREFGQVVLAGVPLSFLSARGAPPPLALRTSRDRLWPVRPFTTGGLLQKIDSRVQGVQLGVQTYSFRTLSSLDEILKAIVTVRLGEAELMYNQVEDAFGAPKGEGAEHERAVREWRKSAPVERYGEVKKKFADAGIDLRLLCFNMNRDTTDDEIEYAFRMARVLGARAISSSTQVSVAKRVAPFADKYRIMVGYHGHSNVKDADEFATPESFLTALKYSKYHGINLDVGHFTAANFDAIPFIKAHHDRITNLHLKDRKRDQGPNVPWGQGDAPIKEVLQLVKRERYPFPANIEFEYHGEDPVAEVAKCFEYCRQALA
jgi:sugar phosphate isomerase/epimerase